MKVSVIIPTFQRPAFLPVALASVARQTLDPQQYEVIVVRDGGRGNVKAVRDAWRGKAQLRYTRIEHAGLSAAVNTGIRMAKGDYFTILPDDDQIMAHKLKGCASFLDRRPEAMVVYSLPKYVEGGRDQGVPKKLRTFLRRHPVLTWNHIKQKHGLWVHGVATMYRKAVVEKAGYWDTALEHAEEYEWHLRLLRYGCDFHALDSITTIYRVHPGSKSRTYTHEQRLRYRKYIIEKLF